jgi:hypothetical protein
MIRNTVAGRRSKPLVAMVVLAAVLAGCGAVSEPSSTPGTESPPPVTDPPPATEPAGPPAASMAFAAGAVIPGTLGGWTWDDRGDAAPWLPGAGPVPVQTGGSINVLVENELPIVTWRARWAPLLATGVGAPVDGIDGSGQIRFGAPPSGSWSVQVEVTFGQGRNATYYWRVQVDG